MEILLLSLASLLAGFVDALAGGGGIITFPVFLFLGIPVSEIVATNKLVSVSGTTIAAATFLKKGLVQKEILKVALPFTVAGSLAGAITVLILPNDFLKPCVSVLIILVALYCFFRPAVGLEHTFCSMTQRNALLTQIAAFALGFYDGFFGPGTGIFLTFFLIKILGCDFLRATANTKVLNWTSNAVPLLYFLIFGSIRFDIGIPMLIANIAGGYLGAHTAIVKGSKFIKWIYLIMATLTGLKLIKDSLTPL
jgi:hypothetical protein